MNTTDRIDELRKKFDENPRRYFAPLANEYRKAGDLLQAIGLCREHLPKQPGHMSGYIVFGQALYESGELTEAQAVFEQALDLDPENLIALRHLGDIARDTGDASAARRWYSRVLDADPRNEDIVAQLATLSATRTPASQPVIQNFDALARMSETPAFAMDAIGLAAVPTPDAVMRAVDVDAWNVRVPSHSPIDLEAITDAPAADGFSNLSQESSSPDVANAPIVPPTDVAFIAEVAHGIPTSPTSVPAIVSLVDDDPFEFPMAAAESLLTDGDPSSLLDASTPVFEEGLLVPEWSDTANVLSQIVTPRDATAIFSASPSPAADADTLAAFGREDGDPMLSFAAPLPTAPPLQAPTRSTADAVFAEVTAVDGDSPFAPMESASVESLFESTDDSPVALSNDNDEVETFVVGETRTEQHADALIIEEEPVAIESLQYDEPLFDGHMFDDDDAASDANFVTPPSSPAFVTETMAELLVSQGFFDRAADVYDELVQRHPFDPALALRRDEVFAMRAPLEAELSSVGDEADNLDHLRVDQIDGAMDSVESRTVEPFDEPITADDADPWVRRPSSTPAYPTPAYLTPVRPTLAYPTPAYLTPVSSPIAPLFSEFPADQSVATTSSRATPGYATPSVGRTVESVASATPTPSNVPYSQPVADVESAPPRLAREWFAALAARRVPRRTPSQASIPVTPVPEGLSSLFGSDAAIHDDAAARALADAFAPVSDDELTAGASLDFAFTATPPFTPTVARTTPPTPVEAQPFQQRERVSQRTTPASSNAGFAFDKFFPDPAARRNTSAAPTPTPPSTPAADDLAQFSSWLKGLGNT